MRPRSLRFAFLAASVVASLVLPSRASAGGAVVSTQGRPDPSILDVRVAVAVSPEGTTRWSEVTVPFSPVPVLWLVPARPGASIAWASNDWLPALEEATAPRIMRPYHSSSCTFSSNVERPAPWTISASKQSSPTYVLHADANSARTAASAGGFVISPEVDARITSLYSAGWNLVAVQIDTPNGSTSSGTLRITDDGGSVLPIALTGSRTVDARITAFTIGAGVATVPGARDIDTNALLWGSSGSSYVSWRRDAIELGNGEVWVRESSSHAALFDGTTGQAPTPSVASRYLYGTTCATSAANAGSSDGIVGATTPASTFSCSGRNDLAIALDGLAPRTSIVTRFSGMVPRGALGSDRALAFDVNGSQQQPAVRAGNYESCPPQNGAAPSRPLAPSPSGGTDEVVTEEGSGSTVVYVGDGCGGDTTTTTTVEEDEEVTTTTSDDSCGGDSTTSSSSSDGWDDSDSDSGDSCGSDSESSSSSSDSCDSSTGKGSDNDGWDTEDDMSAKSKKQSLRLHPRRSKSPFSRYALFAVALILPLRRRARAALER